MKCSFFNVYGVFSFKVIRMYRHFEDNLYYRYTDLQNVRGIELLMPYLKVITLLIYVEVKLNSITYYLSCCVLDGKMCVDYQQERNAKSFLFGHFFKRFWSFAKSSSHGWTLRNKYWKTLRAGENISHEMRSRTLKLDLRWDITLHLSSVSGEYSLMCDIFRDVLLFDYFALCDLWCNVTLLWLL